MAEDNEAPDTEAPEASLTKEKTWPARGSICAFAGPKENKNFGNVLGLSKSEKKDTEAHLLSQLCAEFVGTFFLVFTVGVVVHNTSKGALAPIAIGLMLSIQIYTYGSVSGAMFNPAVTLAVLLSLRSKIDPRKAFLFMCSQFLAGTLAGIMAFAITEKETFCFDWEANKINSGAGVSFVLETLFTSALCTTVLTAGTSSDVPNQYYGFVIGITVMASAFACGGFDQGSFNPAVTWGISIGNLANGDRAMSCDAGVTFFFLFVPFLGSVLSAAIFRGTRNSLEYAKAKQAMIWEKLLAEFVGTFFLVLTVGVAVTGGGPFAEVAIGLMLAVQVYTFGKVSGACLNPAVTVAVLLSGRGKIKPRDAGMYVGIQFLAGFTGGAIAFLATDKTFYFDYELTKAGGAGATFLLEALSTMALCMAVLTTGTSSDAPNDYYGFAIGLTVTASALLNGKYSQGSFNPAVTVGINFANYMNGDSTGKSPAATPTFGAWFFFLVTPFVGSCMAVGVFIATRLKEYQDAHGTFHIMDFQDPTLFGKPAMETE